MTQSAPSFSSAVALYPSESDFGSSEVLDNSTNRNDLETIDEEDDPTTTHPLSYSQPLAHPLAQTPNHPSSPSQTPSRPFKDFHGEWTSSSSTSTALPELSSHHSRTLLSRLKPTNHVVVSRKYPRPASFWPGASRVVKETFTINPHLHIPESLLLSSTSVAQDGEDRPNLSLTVEGGGIDTDIYLMGNAPSAINHDKTRTRLYLSINPYPRNKFALIAKLHTLTPFRPPFYLSATATNGLLCIHLPRSFHGFITVRRHHMDIDRHIIISRELMDCLTIHSEVDDTRRYLVREVDQRNEGKHQEEQWQEGDEVDLRVIKGKIKLQFVDERHFLERMWKRAAGWKRSAGWL